MIECWVDGGGQLRDDRLGELLTKLHAPLIERVDSPDRTLGEHVVLIESDQ